MQGVFHPNVANLYKPIVATAELADIKITRGVTPGYLSDELGWVPPTANVVYEGKARWQKVGLTTKRDFVEDFALFNRVRVQISFKRMPENFTGFMPNDKIELVGNESNPVSEGSAVYYWGDPTSSNAWHHTLNCQQNMKQEG
jgi:hypothetical protein